MSLCSWGCSSPCSAPWNTGADPKDSCCFMRIVGTNRGSQGDQQHSTVGDLHHHLIRVLRSQCRYCWPDGRVLGRPAPGALTFAQQPVIRNPLDRCGGASETHWDHAAEIKQERRRQRTPILFLAHGDLGVSSRAVALSRIGYLADHDQTHSH